jgi:hypothetical protein
MGRMREAKHPSETTRQVSDFLKQNPSFQNPSTELAETQRAMCEVSARHGSLSGEL